MKTGPETLNDYNFDDVRLYRMNKKKHFVLIQFLSIGCLVVLV